VVFVCFISFALLRYVRSVSCAFCARACTVILISFAYSAFLFLRHSLAITTFDSAFFAGLVIVPYFPPGGKRHRDISLFLPISQHRKSFINSIQEQACEIVGSTECLAFRQRNDNF
jgi:hypothetical protein